MEQTNENLVGGIKPEVVTITPELAADFLKMNTHNRRENKRSIATYAEAMRSGKWMLNGEPIIVSNTNVLLDGQNRLYACIRAGVPFQTFVVWGITEDAFKTIDIGGTRKPGDILFIDNIKNANVVAASITRYFTLTSNRISDLGENSGNGGIQLSSLGHGKSDVLDFYHANEGVCERVGEHIVSLGKKGRMVISGSVMGGYELYLILEKKHSEASVRSFFEQLITGRGVENNTIFLLRDALIRHKLKQKVLTGRQRTAYFAKTWNAYVTGRELKILTYSAERENNPDSLL